MNNCGTLDEISLEIGKLNGNLLSFQKDAITRFDGIAINLRDLTKTTTDEHKKIAEIDMRLAALEKIIVDEKLISRLTALETITVNDKGWIAGSYPDNTYIVNGEPFPIASVYRDGKWYSCGLGRYGTTLTSTEVGPTLFAIDSMGNAYGMCYDKGTMASVVPFGWKYNAVKDDYKTDTLAFSTPCVTGDQGSRINGISSDGKVAGGWITRSIYGGVWQPIVWNGSASNYKVFETGYFSEARGVSSDGHYVALESNHRAAIYDTQKDSLIVFGVEGSIALAVSDNGFVVGYINQIGGRQAFIWSDKLGFMVFRDFLDKYCSNVEMPVDPTQPDIFNFPKDGGVFDVPMSISADGRHFL